MRTNDAPETTDGVALEQAVQRAGGQTMSAVYGIAEWRAADGRYLVQSDGTIRRWEHGAWQVAGRVPVGLSAGQYAKSMSRMPGVHLRWRVRRLTIQAYDSGC